MSFNALLHFRTESSHFAAMLGILCIIELYSSYVHCSFRAFPVEGFLFFSFCSTWVEVGIVVFILAALYPCR